MRLSLAASLFVLTAPLALSGLTPEQLQVPLEIPPPDSQPSDRRILLIAGTPSNKPGQHEYFAGCALLRQWLAELPGVAPVMAAEGWPQNEAAFEGVSSVLLFLDGGSKLPFLSPDRRARLHSLASSGVGFVVLHQGVDCPADLVSDFKGWFGAAFQSDIGCRGHWDVAFSSVPSHEITRGITPFSLPKDGWLYNLHFAESGVTPILSCQMPDSSRKTAHAKARLGQDETVAWAYQRPDGGRSFGFTGCDLHSNFGEPNQRRLLLNALLWTAKLPVPESGVASTVTPAELSARWDRKLFQPKPKKPAP